MQITPRAKRPWRAGTASCGPVVHVTVEVLDPVAGELVARRDFNEMVMFVATPDDDVLIFSLHPDALGDLDCVIRPLTLRRG